MTCTSRTTRRGSRTRRLRSSTGSRSGPAASSATRSTRCTFPSLTGAGLNGIEGTPNGKTLILAAFTTGRLYTLDTETLEVNEIVLDELVPRGDGLVLSGKTLYVVQNLPSAAVPGVPGQVAVVELSNDLSSGEVVAHLNSADAPLVNPATADQFGNALYIVRRAAPAPAPASFYITRILKH